MVEEVQRKKTKFKKKKDDLSYKGDPVLNKYIKRGEGYDFSNITKEDKEYLEKKRKQDDNLLLTPEMMKSKTIGLMKDGGEVKKYMGGGSVHKKKNKMATTKGWGASRKT